MLPEKVIVMMVRELLAHGDTREKALLEQVLLVRALMWLMVMAAELE